MISRFKQMDSINFKDDPFFTEADFCLPIVHPNCLIGVQDQGRTNACYAFVVVNCIYADLSIHKGEGFRGSEQEFLDCLHLKYPLNQVVDKDNPPKAGYPNTFPNAFTYVSAIGLSLNENYKWRGSCGRCVRNDIDMDGKILIRSHTCLMSVDEVVERLHNHYAVTCSIILTKVLRKWTGDEIYTVTENEIRYMENRVNSGMRLKRHGMLIIGYGSKNGIDYFVAQNTYGTKWAYKGYIKIEQRCVSCFYYVEGSKLKVESKKKTK